MFFSINTTESTERYTDCLICPLTSVDLSKKSENFSMLVVFNEFSGSQQQYSF